jgi:hypothetical protein
VAEIDRSANTMVFKRAMSAYRNPGFYRQLGQDPDQIIAVALRMLATRFDLQTDNRFVAG